MPATGHVAARVCILLEGNAPMARHWSDFLNIYLLPLFRSLELQPSGLTEVSLVVYYTRSTYSLCHLERSDWVSSWEEVNSLLATAHISGGGNSESCLPDALAEALYLFQTPSALKPAEKLAQHCLLLSLTEAHNMAIGWPYPLLPGAESQGTQVASFSLGMAEAFKQQGISLSLFSTYPPGLSNTSWPSLLFKLFAHAEQEHTHTAKAEEQQQQQQQQRGKLREECSVGMKPGHFVMLSRQWGPVVKLLQGQRNKRKADQAFQDVPLTDYQGKHAAAFATPQHQAGKALKTESTPGQRVSPFQASAAAPVKIETNANGPVSAVQSVSALVDLTSPIAASQPMETATVDLTNEESPQMAPGLFPGLPHVNNTTARLVKPQLQSELQAGRSTSVHYLPGQPLPNGHSQQHRPPQVVQPTGCTPHPQSSQGPSSSQQQPSLPQAQARQQTPSPVNSAPASLTFQQQQKLLLQQQQQFQQAQLHQRQQQQQQQQQRPTPVPPQGVGPGSQQQQQLQGFPPASLQAPQLQQQYPQFQQPHPQQQQQPPQLQLPQQHQQQQWQVAQAAAAQGEFRQQAETAPQPSRHSSSSPPQGVPRIPQAQQQLLNLQQQLRLQQQMPQQLPQQLPQSQQARGLGGASPHAGRVKPGQAHTLQQIQAMQSQLKVQVQGQSQGQVATALSQHSFSQDQGQAHLANGIPRVNFNPGQVRQGQPSAALPQARPGQLPAFSPPRAAVSNGPRALPVPAMRSPTASSSGSVAASPVKSGGAPVLVWEGEIQAAGPVMKETENQHLMQCRLLAKPGTWPPTLDLGWSHPLVVNKNIYNAELTKLLGANAFSQAPRLAVQMIELFDKGRGYIEELAVQKAMGIVQVPTAGKFLGILVTSAPGAPQPKLLGLLLNLPQQQTQRPSQVQR